ncbi:hypothetical protein MML48_4g00002086 [Holotrichia oblita]|uniref:Uncharacterized protein n=3 Tax=Holotrichia oblita TaxID=644536 RepID=A0ACB9T864_HOLOL|nr:hypothetical protein MML48_4g00018986 [Holotrichia oblita]KAI4462922.1 hypothetical protein MML48_4g00016517 [Holotrichia oblita]KAI4462995.1 hypothetical protein MML48_4g00002086 [Holotrichia oblita]
MDNNDLATNDRPQQENLQQNNEVTQAAPHAPLIPMTSYSTDDIPPPKADFSAPPPYEAATKLPTYEEVQREKHLEGQSVLQNTRVSLCLIICIRAILQYLSIKRGWRMLTASHQERLLFFY